MTVTLQLILLLFALAVAGLILNRVKKSVIKLLRTGICVIGLVAVGNPSIPPEDTVKPPQPSTHTATVSNRHLAELRSAVSQHGATANAREISGKSLSQKE